MQQDSIGVCKHWPGIGLHPDLEPVSSQCERYLPLCAFWIHDVDLDRPAMESLNCDVVSRDLCSCTNKGRLDTEGEVQDIEIYAACRAAQIVDAGLPTLRTALAGLDVTLGVTSDGIAVDADNGGRCVITFAWFGWRRAGVITIIWLGAAGVD